ncbi:hypothetical protein [Kitasatospora terrestris]
MTLATAAAVETDRDCRENTLHALGELADTGLFGTEFFEPIRHLDPNTLDVNEREYVDALLELDR